MNLGHGTEVVSLLPNEKLKANGFHLIPGQWMIQKPHIIQII
jgi:hypothetical protein